MMKQPLAGAAWPYKGKLSQTKFSQVSSLQKRMINWADSSVFTSAILSQECQHVIIPPSIIVMGLSIGSLWQTLRNRTRLQDRLHRLTRSAVWSIHERRQELSFFLILSTTLIYSPRLPFLSILLLLFLSTHAMNSQCPLWLMVAIEWGSFTDLYSSIKMSLADRSYSTVCLKHIKINAKRLSLCLLCGSLNCIQYTAVAITSKHLLIVNPFYYPLQLLLCFFS